MRRREFIAALGSAAAWPLTGRAQQGERMRHIGILIDWAEADPEAKAELSAFSRGLSELGWTNGRNVRMDVRFGSGNVDRMEALAKELVDLQPDAILANSTPATAAFQRVTRTIPIVFMTVSDPVGSGFVTSLPRPGGNLTGFSNHESSMVGKWLELLTQIAPGIKRTAMMFNPEMSPYVRSYYLPLFEAGARSLKVEPILAPVRSKAEIETIIASLGREPGGSIIVMPDAFVYVHRTLIISLAIRSNLPSVSNISAYVRDGGLLSYGPDSADVFHRAASYVDPESSPHFLK
jgi:putative tryptophan/tyrosine transport system substrate-binding protein